MDPLLTSSALELSHHTRRGELRSVDLVDWSIRAIERVNPTLHALVADRFADARAEARAADERAARSRPEDLPLLHGVPCSIKESFALEGMPNCAGLASRRAHRAQRDAVTVARLRAAGAIPLGVTNVSELCMWMESSNRVYGRTGNPYDPSRTAGGSSGGEAAAVGAGAVPFGLGSDIGGSIRLPSFFCGVFGHKPTGGLVPSTGQYPQPTGAALRYVTTGPIARRAEDLWPLLWLLAGPDGEDSGCRPLAELCSPVLAGEPLPAMRDEPVAPNRPSQRPALPVPDLSTLRVIDVPDNGTTPVSSDLRRAQSRAARYLERRGAHVEQLRFAGLRHSIQIWGAMLHEAGGPSFAELLGEGRAIRPGRELGRWLLGRSLHTFPAIGLAILERAPTFSGRSAARFIAKGRELQREIEERIGPHGVMLFPSYATVAPAHARALLTPLRFGHTAILNALELPATQVPLALDARGIPLGVQVASVRGNDALCIAVARELERGLGGWVPPARWWPTAPR